MPTTGISLQGRPVRAFVAGCIFLACALCFVLPSGYSYGSALLCLSSVPLLLWFRPALGLSRADGWMIAALLFYFAVNALLNAYHGLSSRYYEEPSRFLLGVAILLAVMGFAPSARYWWSGLVVGTSLGGVVALWQIVVEGQARAGGFMNPIQFGNLSLLMGCLCLAGLGWARHRRCTVQWTLALCIAAVLGILGSMLSGARGGWLALPILLAILYFNFRRHMSRRLLATGLASLLLLLAALYAIPQTGIQERLNRASTELDGYLDHGSATSSVGIRLVMWRSVLDLSSVRPWAGWGETAYVEPMKAQIEDERVRAIVGKYDHVHNDTLDTLIKRGAWGLLALLVVYLVPFVLFAQQLYRADRQASQLRAFALCGVLLVVGVMLFGLTQAFFRHNSGVTLYAFFLVVIWGYMRSAHGRDSDDGR
ncbi:O-antigen ligase family protein [Gilvimarinus algae]|uniref:O-antigen ligase family protein n=1 Tax=Gilvimarinus algae TaxID=3058037 RepID=A0ABT8TA73_9GAMM|nr:O-antigen ligase family protein [Gilvimarinus sp. SDUM040014]MDO3381019.1 O-antigen ligase family protein [Gilvimarinus sp. SDUM040014]